MGAHLIGVEEHGFFEGFVEGYSRCVGRADGAHGGIEMFEAVFLYARGEALREGVVDGLFGDD